MSENPIRQVELELHQMAQAYAAKAESFASDPYFRDAIVKVAVSNFVWSLYHAFSQDSRSIEVLHDELTEQRAAIGRTITPNQVAVQ